MAKSPESARLLILRAALLTLLVGGWQLASNAGWLNPFVLPSPGRVLAGFFQLARGGELSDHVLASLNRVLVGYGISLATAIPLGLCLGLLPRVRKCVSPVIALLRPIPPMAWIPLTILWFGLGNGPSYFITMVSSFFPLLLNTMTGVESVEPRHLEVAQTFGASRWMTLYDVVLPSAAPFIVSGMRIGLTVSWMSVIAAEMVSATRGLGYFIEMKQEMVQTDLVIAGMLAIGLTGVALDFLIMRFKSRWIRWQNQALAQ